MTAEHILRDGSDLTLVCYGTMVNAAMVAAAELSAKGISAEVIKLGVLCPNDFSLCLASLKIYLTSGAARIRFLLMYYDSPVCRFSSLSTAPF